MVVWGMGEGSLKGVEGEFAVGVVKSKGSMTTVEVGVGDCFTRAQPATMSRPTVRINPQVKVRNALPCLGAKLMNDSRSM
jgi:hypothetical protein